jgi:fimbrial isopeptide formation D2 family protein/uncharacterized repeat protein (TIGR01451 family)
MKTINKKKFFGADALIVLVAIAISINAFSDITSAKSLYVLSDSPSDKPEEAMQPLQLYNINTDGTLTFQTKFLIPRLYGGAVAITIDSNTDTLFFTYGYRNLIMSCNASEIDYPYGITTVEDVSNIVGIVYDHEKHLLYAIEEGKNLLYVFDWDASASTLNPVTNSPFALAKAKTYGMALDEIDDLLYVTNATNTIYAYDTSDWSLERTISISRTATSIAVDVQNGYLYTGEGHHYLTQYHLATNTEKEVQVEEDAGVMGLCVDPDTNYVFVSTGNINTEGGDNLLVYNTLLKRVGIVKNVGNPTGLAAPGGNVGYNPMNLSKVATGGVTENEEDGIPRLNDADGLITYSIYFDSKNLDVDNTDVAVTDTLPNNVTFISAEDDGVVGNYNPITHTYTWVYPYFAKGTSESVKITVKADDNLLPGATITNFVTLNSNQTQPTTKSVEVIKTNNPINIKTSVYGTPDGTLKKVDPGELITYRITFNTNDLSFKATGVTIVDKLPQEVQFISADNGLIVGSYDVNKHAYTWQYSDLLPNSSAHVDIIVKVKSDIEPGTIITNKATIDSLETPASSSSVNVMTDINILTVTKTVVDAFYDGVSYKIGADELLTYNIHFDSNEGTYPFTGVTIVDTLPDEVTFVSADGDGTIGLYDDENHTFIWSYTTVQPGTIHDLKLKVKVKDDVSIGTTIINTVTLSCNEAPTTSSVVSVITHQSPLLVSSVQFIPNVLRRYNGTVTSMAAIVQLPSEYKLSDIKESKLILYPGNVKAVSQQITSTAQGVKIVAVFNKSDILQAISGYGKFEMIVIGTFKSDRSFYGEQNLWIASFVGY